MKIDVAEYGKSRRVRRMAWVAAALGMAGMATSVCAAVIAHNSVRGFADNLTHIEWVYKPYLKVLSGCVPFPAVDAAGNVSGGLQNSGAINGGCGGNTGQVYAREGSHNGQCAVMYAWYFPKDQNVDGGGNSGHRHDWENIVVWFDKACNQNPAMVAVSYSSHGKYYKSTRPDKDGNNPKVRSFQHPFNTHELGTTTQKGGMQPGIDYYRLTAAARNTLNNHNFGSAVVPFKDSNFQNNLAKAYYR